MNWFDRVSQWFSLDEADSGQLQADPARLYTCLLLEVALSDHHVSDEEKHLIMNVLEKRFEMATEQAETLYRESLREVEQATSMHPWTRRANEELSHEERVVMMEWLWSAAFADGHLDAYEENTIRRIADLLHVPHRLFIRSKHRASGGGESANS